MKTLIILTGILLASTLLTSQAFAGQKSSINFNNLIEKSQADEKKIALEINGLLKKTRKIKRNKYVRKVAATQKLAKL